MSKLEELGFTGPYTLQQNGSVNAVLSGYPYNIHETATPDMWGILQLDIVQNAIYIEPSCAPVVVEPTAEQVIKAQIAALEASITPRRMREAILGIDNGWLAGVDAQIAKLR